MIYNNIRGERALIASIINLSIHDALNFTCPRNLNFLPKKKIFNISEEEEHSFNARRFLRLDNELFCIYSNLLGIDPKYLSKKIRYAISCSDNGKRTYWQDYTYEEILLSEEQKNYKEHSLPFKSSNPAYYI